ncbi:hypothetical protein BX667DRAFT_508734 [Coemansia mojavensis]|nr:hypothetical protein BX667DRAFT_508734 [Coemansia mojavensis]
MYIFAVTLFAAFAIAHRQLYIYGDSLSDTGRFKHQALGLIPPKPYWNGRFSDGPVWCEYTAAHQNLTLESYAVGTAASTNNHTHLFGVFPMTIPSTRDQIANSSPNVNGSTAVLEVGANDVFRSIHKIHSGRQSIDEFVESLSSLVLSQLQALSDMGFTSILVTTLPALDKAPIIGLRKQTKLARQIIDAYNQQLLAKVSSQSARVGVLDMDRFMQTALSQKVTEALGIKNSKCPCVGKDFIHLLSNNDIAHALLKFVFSSKTHAVCTNPQEHFFWDPLHPSAQVHRLFGHYAHKAISAANNSLEITEDMLVQIIKEHSLDTLTISPKINQNNEPH